LGLRCHLWTVFPQGRLLTGLAFESIARVDDGVVDYLQIQRLALVIRAGEAGALAAAHQNRLRTSNALERVNQELKRRTRVPRVFPNETSLLRLISALLAETSDEWETGKIYLNMENQNPHSA
jgi:hypothetical protein